jgi:DNA invertase Pin-like site-specific DNA recombinase
LSPFGVSTRKKTACYVRISTASQNEASQRREIQRWLDGHGIQAEWFIDKKSGDTLKRPAFERLQAAVFAGEVDTIVVYKLDRISRSLRDGINTLCGWCERGVRVVSVTQQLDFSGSTGQLIASVLFAVAQMEQETRRERQAAGIAVARELGKYRGRKGGTTKAAPKRALELRAKGLTDREIATALGISLRTVQRYLSATAVSA